MPTASRPDKPVRLRAAPNFVQAHTLDGRPFVAKDCEPYTQYWLSERERVLLAQFSGRHGAAVDAAEAGYFRSTGVAPSETERRRIAKAIAGMRDAGVLIGHDEDTSRYSEAIAADYIAHRPYPRDVVEHIVRATAMKPATRVLDLAGGPGCLALALAETSQRVALMELSRGFLKTAARRAAERGLHITTLHDSCNRLIHHDTQYDVVTVSQALHWLDDVAVCRGLCRLLLPDGSFFVVHAVMEVPDSHPLAHLLGYDSILGAKERVPFAHEVQPLLRRLSLLFDALDAPDVQRVDPTHARHGGGTHQRIAPASVALFRQPRPFGPGFARGFFTPQHIAVSGMSEQAFWQDLQARCATATADDLMGTQHWAVLHFQRGADAANPPRADAVSARTIGYDGPGEI